MKRNSGGMHYQETAIESVTILLELLSTFQIKNSSRTSCKGPPKKQRPASHLWEEFAYDNHATGDLSSVLISMHLHAYILQDK